jgi:hypothetical protein
MKRSFFSLALLACVSMAVAVCSALAAPIQVVATAFKAWALAGIELVGGGSGCVTPASIRITQAKAFVQRIAKRERPVVTSSWRMCPST